MTVTLTRRTSRYWWVPAAAGWTVGIIATLSLIASVSPGIRWVIKEPREFVNHYIFNFPDTSFAWAFADGMLLDLAFTRIVAFMPGWMSQ